jgi:hypothetical protein
MEPGVVMIVAIVFGVLGTVLFPVARALARRIEGRSAATTVPADVTDRLDRIERAVESVALEVERISEGQRFVTKLMAGRAEPTKLPPSSH